MKITETYLKGCFVIEPKIFDDNKVSMFEGTYEDFLTKVGWQDE